MYELASFFAPHPDPFPKEERETSAQRFGG